MLSNSKFSIDELIEETFLESANVKEIITWLKKNFIQKQKKIRPSIDDYPELRKKYEPIWAEKNDKLKLAICSYGKNIKILRNIFFSNSDQYFKIAILQNGFFSSQIKPYNDPNLSSLTIKEIMDIYEKEKSEENLNNGLFYYIFSNPWISEEVIFSVFSKEDKFKKINKNHLQTIFNLMIFKINNDEQNFFKLNKYYDFQFLNFLDDLFELILQVDISKKPEFLYNLESLLRILRENGYEGSFNINEDKLKKFLSKQKQDGTTPEIIMMDNQVILDILDFVKVKTDQNPQDDQYKIKDIRDTINNINANNKFLNEKLNEYEEKIKKLEINLSEIYTKIYKLEPKLDNIFDKLKKEEQDATNRYYNLYEKIDQPNDLFSRILLKIPIFNRLFRLLIK